MCAILRGKQSRTPRTRKRTCVCTYIRDSVVVTFYIYTICTKPPRKLHGFVANFNDYNVRVAVVSPNAELSRAQFIVVVVQRSLWRDKTAGSKRGSLEIISSGN